MGHQATKTELKLDQGPVWGLEQLLFGILIGLWPETQENVQHCSYL